MVTAPQEERLNRGRGSSSAIRTPQLIRDYLSGQGTLPEDTPEERAARPAQGDYLARMRRRIKLFIRTMNEVRICPVELRLLQRYCGSKMVFYSNWIKNPKADAPLNWILSRGLLSGWA
jgi:hypothetical protein